MKIKYLIPAFIWSVAILIMLLLPSSQIPSYKILKIPHLDKIIHFGMFLGLSILLVFGFMKQNKNSFLFKDAYTITLVICVFYSAGTEFLQSISVSLQRMGSALDFAANMAGTITGLILYFVIMKIKIFRNLITSL